MIKGYLSDERFLNDRNCFGVGVLVYTPDSLSTVRRQDLEFQDGELIWLKIRCKQYKNFLCTDNRPPCALVQHWKNMKLSIEQALDENARIMINGDLNGDLLNDNINT